MSGNIVEAMGRKYMMRWNTARYLYDHRNDDLLNNNNLSSWLYDSDWSEDKWRQYALLARVPGISDYMDYLLDYRDAKDYFRNTGLDWSNIRDPRKLSVTGSYGRLITSVSKNIDSLY